MPCVAAPASVPRPERGVEPLNLFELVFSAAVVVVAFAVRGTAGFGGQVIAVPLLALVLPLQLVLSAIVVLTGLAALGHLRRDWPRIEWAEIRRLLPFSMIGVICGLYLLRLLDFHALLRAFAVFVILYGCFVLATVSRPVHIPRQALRPAGMILSTLAGAMGATFGAAAGPLYVIYLDSCRLERNAFRVTITTILTVQAVLRVVGYARLGWYEPRTFVLIAAGFPLMMLGAGIGSWLGPRLPQRWFGLGIGALLIVSGAALLLK